MQRRGSYGVRTTVCLAIASCVCGMAAAANSGSATAPADGNARPTGEERKSRDEEPQHVGSEEVIITAPRADIPLRESPSATSVVEAGALEGMPRTVGADEALLLVPGVKVDNQADGERVHLSIRGQGILTERGIRGVKVLLDGIPLNDPTGFAPDLFDVDWATVQRIEVLRGPASSLYGGGGSGGILNITTRDGGPGPVEGTARFTAGSNGFVKALSEAGGEQDGVRYRFSASRTQGAGYRVHTAFQGTNLYGKIRLRDVGSLRLTAVVAGTSFFNENAEGLNIDQVREDPRQPNPDALTFNEYQQTRRGTAGLVGRVELSPASSLGFTVYGHHTLWREAVPSSVQHRVYDGFGGSLQYTLTSKLGGMTNHFNLGTDLDWQDIDDTRRPNLGRAREGAEILSDEAIAQRGAGYFAFDRLELGGAWSLVGGVRHDRITNRLMDNLQTGGVDLSGQADFSKTTARAGVAWDMSPSVGLYVTWGQGFLPPATEELANNPASLGGFNRDLRPATSRSVEVGARGTRQDTFAFDVAVFRLLTANDFGRYRIESRPLETFYRNAGASKRYGLETLLSWYPVAEVTARLAYTYSHFTYDRVEIGDGTYRDAWLPNIPRQQAYLDVEYRPVEGLAVGVGVQAMGRAWIDGSNVASIGSYTLVNLRVACRVTVAGVDGELLVSARNVTNTAYIAFTEPDPDGNSYQPGPLREVFGGILLHL